MLRNYSQPLNHDKKICKRNMQTSDLTGFDTDASRILAKANLSERQANFVWLYLQGASKEAAAEAAGYSATSGSAVFRSAKVQAALVAVSDRFLLGELAPMALRTAHKLMGDDKTPSGVRATLALGILDRAGFTAKRHEKADGARFDAASATSDQLQAEIDRLQAEIDAKMRDITPDGAPTTNQDIDLYP
jgi:hypothetical protein